MPKRKLLVVSSGGDGNTTESYIEIGKERLIFCSKQAIFANILKLLISLNSEATVDFDLSS